jgi:hypothetical protein
MEMTLESVAPAPRPTLQRAVAALHARYGSDVLREAHELSAAVPPRFSTGFPALDALSGGGGVPQGHLTLFTGGATSGKLSVALRSLAAAQGRHRRRDPVAVLDLAGTADPQSFHLAGVDLAHTLFIRPPRTENITTLLYDVLNVRAWRCLLVDGVGTLRTSPHQLHTFDAALPELMRVVRRQRTALLLLDDAGQPGDATAHSLSLHMHFRRTDWQLSRHGGIVGCTTRVQLERSRWARPGAHCDLTLPFP